MSQGSRVLRAVVRAERSQTDFEESVEVILSARDVGVAESHIREVLSQMRSRADVVGAAGIMLMMFCGLLGITSPFLLLDEGMGWMGALVLLLLCGALSLVGWAASQWCDRQLRLTTEVARRLDASC